MMLLPSSSSSSLCWTTSSWLWFWMSFLLVTVMKTATAATADYDDVYPAFYYGHIKRVSSVQQLLDYADVQLHQRVVDATALTVFVRMTDLRQAACVRNCGGNTTIAWSNATRHFGANHHPRVLFVEVDLTRPDTDESEWEVYVKHAANSHDSSSWPILWYFPYHAGSQAPLAERQYYASSSRQDGDDLTNLDHVTDWIEASANTTLCDCLADAREFFCNDMERHFCDMMLVHPRTLPGQEPRTGDALEKQQRDTWEWRLEKFRKITVQHGPKAYRMNEWNWRRARILQALLDQKAYQKVHEKFQTSTTDKDEL